MEENHVFSRHIQIDSLIYITPQINRKRVRSENEVRIIGQFETDKLMHGNKQCTSIVMQKKISRFQLHEFCILHKFLNRNVFYCLTAAYKNPQMMMRNFAFYNKAKNHHK